MKGKLSRRDTIPNSRKLTELEEEKLVEYILDLDSRSFPPRISGVEDMANRLLADCDAPPVGKRWASNFVKRQPQLRTRFFRKYDCKGAQCEDLDAINAWFRLVANIIAKYGIVDSDIYNFDKTGFMMGQIASGMVVTSAERRSNTKMMQPGNREWVTVIQAISSLGYSVPPYIIVAGQYHLSTWYMESGLPRDWVIATSENGWTTNERGLDWLQHFDRHTKPRASGSYRLLIVDGHESHHAANFEMYCQENNIITLCMPAHSSHLLQPLDVGCFGPLKKAYGRQIEDKMRRGNTHITKEDFFPAFREAFTQALTVKNIQGGFRGAGLVPLSAESVLSKLDVKLNTPTPPGSLPATPSAWTSQTPNNPIEASSQSELIKRRISSHQNSSPTSIIEAVEHLSKRARGFMHQIALLRSEVQILREENNLLSRRRRTKKTSLRQGGSLTVAEAEDLQLQREATAQIEEETRRSSGCRPRTEIGKRRCGVCGNTGHNARTCQFIEETSNEEVSE
ncbi:transposase [Colletotrichum chrysophilum]|uniref:Transposase n=1 Tax=Colletotrichum chrysophilum TaxID=1836956 RepID=A0AAD9A1S9_9PEZI|nr:transposase [Colletotrichum chrysophilum]